MSRIRGGTYRPGRVVDEKGFLIRGINGHAALMTTDDPGVLVAQFDDTTSDLAYGWHPFPASHFVLDPEDD